MGNPKYLLGRRVLGCPQISPSPPAMLMAEAENIRIYSPFLAGGKLVI
jgi:hypothetical protein